MEAQVNLLGVLLAGLSAIAVNIIWYTNAVFGATWQKLTQIKETRSQRTIFVSTLFMFVLAMVTAYVLAHLAYISKQFYPTLTFQEITTITALWVWLGFFLYATASLALMEIRPRKLIFINLANQLITLLVMSLVIGAFGL